MVAKIRYFSKMIGISAIALSFFECVPLLYSLFVEEPRDYTLKLSSVMIITALVGISLMYVSKKNVYKPTKWSNLMLGAVVWIFVSFFGALPYSIVLKMHWIDAFFESTSGFTTTGITVLSGFNVLPRSMLLWRSMTQWIGGMIILVYFLFVTFKNEDQFWLGYSSILNPLKLPKRISNLYKGIIVFISIYTSFIIVQSIILALFGMSIFHAITLSMTVVSTGGFSNFEVGFMDANLMTKFQVSIIQYIVLTFMAISGMSYFIHARLVTRDFKSLFSNAEAKSYFKIIFISVFVFLSTLIIIGRLNVQSFMESLFQVVSAVSTSGLNLQSQDLLRMPLPIKSILVALIFIGGSMASTSGGFKINRMVVLYKSFNHDVKSNMRPSQVISSVKYDGHTIDLKFVSKVALLFFAWIAFIYVGYFILSITTNLSQSELFIGAIGAIGNSGVMPITAQQMKALDVVPKMVYILLMLVGRVEIMPFILLFNIRSWKA